MTNNEVNNKKRNLIIVGILLLLLLCVSLGSAYLSQMLQINGTTNIGKSSWSIYFDNEAEQSDSVEATNPLTIDTNKTLITFGVTFTKPGEFYEFEVDTVNDGAMDAMVNRVTKAGISEENAKYINFEATYNDGSPINQYDLLAKNTRERIKVRVEFKEVDNKEDLPPSDLDLNLELQIEYSQSDENAHEREEIKKDPAILRASYLVVGDIANSSIVSNVKRIIFDNKINTPTNAIATADFSVNNDGKVIAYVVANDSDSTKYDLHIEGDGSLYANPNSSQAFAPYSNVEEIIGGEKLNTSLITNMERMFMSLSKLTNINTSTWDLSNVTNMSMTFAGCTALLELDGTNWGLHSVTNMLYAFSGCTILSTLGDTSNWDLSNLTRMDSTFSDCNSLTSLGTANWNTSKVENFQGTFYKAENLVIIDISNIDFTSATNTQNMFQGANKITGTLNMNGTHILSYGGGMFVGYVPEGESITINYTAETESIVNAMIENTADARLKKGNLIEG